MNLRLFDRTLMVVSEETGIAPKDMVGHRKSYPVAMARHFFVLALLQQDVPEYQIEFQMKKSRGCARNSRLSAEAEIATNRYYREVFGRISQRLGIQSELSACSSSH